MSSEQSQIEVGGQAIRVDPALFKGQVYDGRLTFSGARLCCWASHAASNKPPGRFVLMAAGKATAEQAPTMASERAAGMAENGAAQFDIALEAMPLPLSARFDVYAVAADEPAATLLPKEEDYLLDRIAIANESEAEAKVNRVSSFRP